MISEVRLGAPPEGAKTIFKQVGMIHGQHCDPSAADQAMGPLQLHLSLELESVAALESTVVS